jgi:hypothetical protein
MSSWPGPAPRGLCSKKIGIMSHHMISNDKDRMLMNELGGAKGE